MYISCQAGPQKTRMDFFLAFLLFFDVQGVMQRRPNYSKLPYLETSHGMHINTHT